MKKILLILFILSLLFTFGCIKDVSDDTSDNIVSSEKTLEYMPLNRKLTAYESIVIGVSYADSGNVNNWSADITVEDSVFGAVYEESDIEPVTTTVNGIEQTFTYYETVENRAFFDSSRNAKTRVYEYSDKEVDPTYIAELHIDVNSGKISKIKNSLNTRHLEQSDAVISKDQCREIGTSFINKTNPDVDLREYTFTESELKKNNTGTKYEHNYYVFNYRKYVNGYATSDYISVCVTEYGAITSYSIGDLIDKNEVSELNVDYERAYNSVDSIAKKVNGQKTTIKSPVYYKLSNGVYALYYNIVVGDGIGNVVVLVPLQDG